MNRQSAFINEESHEEIVKKNEEEKHKELKRQRNCERQRAYYHRQKDLKKNEEKIKKKVPKTNAERQREFRQRNARKSYVDMKRRKFCSKEENVVQGRADENIDNVTLQENKFHSQQLHIHEQRKECTPEVILHRNTGIPGDAMAESDPPADFNMEINIKEETELVEDITIHIKSEIETNDHEITAPDHGPDLIDMINEPSPFENVQLEVKEEMLSPTHDKDVIPSHSDIMVTLPTNLEPDLSKEMDLDRHIDVKDEMDAADELVTYDYPSFDEGSMDSADAAALGNVEACLQDDIKTEEGQCDDDYIRPEYNNLVKQETDLTVTETHLISNKLINTTSTITHPQDGLIESRTTKTLVMEILPMSTISQTLNKIENPEEILPTTHSNEEYDSFQLNSITGNVLSLEQEAYGLLKAKPKCKQKKTITCPKCPKTFDGYYGLKRHLNVHVSIENRAKGLLKGLETRKENQQKKMMQVKAENSKGIKKEGRNRKRRKYDVKEEEFKTKAKIKSETRSMKSDVKKEGYECTCGQVFQRRSRMETCLRSHNLYSDTDNKYPCVTCMRQFKDKEELALHRKRLHRKKFPCKFCPTDYGTRKELFKHLQIHQKVQLMEYKVISEFVKNKKKLKCFMCTKSYIEISDLTSHVMEDHKEPYICPLCNGTFCKIIDFAHHTKSFHPEIEGQSVLDVLEAFSKLVKAWKCEECDLQFHEADKLALHQIEVHSPDMKLDCQFQCPDCRRVFISQKGLTSHRRIHHSTESLEEAEEVEKGVMCLECRKICKDVTALTSHMRLHSPERKYPCKFCDFRFATPEKRKAHAEIHTGDLKYVCFICEYQCSSENRLKQHKLSVKHSSMKEFLLTGTPMVQESSSSKKNSKKKKKEEKKEDDSDSSVDEVSCDICGEKFTSEAAMAEHKQTHPFIEFPHEDTPSRIFFK